MERRTALILLGALLAVLLLFVYRIAEPFLRPLVAAAILAIALDPLHRRLERIGAKPTLAALLTTLLTLLLLLPFLVAGYVLAGELAELYQGLSQRSAEEGGWLALATRMVEPRLAERFPALGQVDLRAELLAWLKVVSAWALAEVREVIGSVTAFLGNLAITLLVLVFLLRDGRAFAQRLLASLPLRPEHSERLARTLSESITANMYGVLAVALGQGILMGLAFAFLGLPSPVLWGLVGALISLIPLVGTATLWAPTALILVLTGHYWKALIMVIWGLGGVGMFDNIMRPLLVGRSVKQHPLLLLFSMLGGVQAFGVLGLILGPVVLAVTVTTATALQEELAEWRATRERPGALSP